MHQEDRCTCQLTQPLQYVLGDELSQEVHPNRPIQHRDIAAIGALQHMNLSLQNREP